MHRAENRLLMVPVQGSTGSQFHCDPTELLQAEHQNVCQDNSRHAEAIKIYNGSIRQAHNLIKHTAIMSGSRSRLLSFRLTIKGNKKAQEPDEGKHGGPGWNADVPGQVVCPNELLPPEKQLAL